MVHGTVAPGFEPVRDVFARHFEEAGEVGASVCVIRDGQPLVDLWGGLADPTDGTPWEADTLVNIFSTSKGVVAHAVLRLVDQGLMDLDAPVAEVWPDFARNGKAGVTLRQILNHRSGVAAVDRRLSLADVLAWDVVEDALVNQAPLWEPGTDQGYHPVTWGMLMRAIVPRATGRGVEEHLADVAGSLQADVHLGLPDALLPRCARLQAPVGAEIPRTIARRLVERGVDGRFFRNVFLRPRGDAARAFGNPRSLGAFGFANYDTVAVRQAVLPWTNVHASARGLARHYAPLAGDGEAFGVRTLSPETARLPREPHSWSEQDRVIRIPMGWALGFRKEETGIYSPNPSWFGHPGTGGSVGFADPDAGISFGYVMNKLRTHVRSPTALALSRAVYDCLGTPVEAR